MGVQLDRFEKAHPALFSVRRAAGDAPNVRRGSDEEATHERGRAAAFFLYDMYIQ